MKDRSRYGPHDNYKKGQQKRGGGTRNFCNFCGHVFKPYSEPLFLGTLRHSQSSFQGRRTGIFLFHVEFFYMVMKEKAGPIL
jgi:hypothetical protein